MSDEQITIVIPRYKELFMRGRNALHVLRGRPLAYRMHFETVRIIMHDHTWVNFCCFDNTESPAEPTHHMVVLPPNLVPVDPNWIADVLPYLHPDAKEYMYGMNTLKHYNGEPVEEDADLSHEDEVFLHDLVNGPDGD